MTAIFKQASTSKVRILIGSVNNIEPCTSEMLAVIFMLALVAYDDLIWHVLHVMKSSSIFRPSQ